MKINPGQVDWVLVPKYECCVFRPTNGCFAHSLVEVHLFSPFPVFWHHFHLQNNFTFELVSSAYVVMEVCFNQSDMSATYMMYIRGDREEGRDNYSSSSSWN